MKYLIRTTLILLVCFLQITNSRSLKRKNLQDSDEEEEYKGVKYPSLVSYVPQDPSDYQQINVEDEFNITLVKAKSKFIELLKEKYKTVLRCKTVNEEFYEKLFKKAADTTTKDVLNNFIEIAKFLKREEYYHAKTKKDDVLVYLLYNHRVILDKEQTKIKDYLRDTFKDFSFYINYKYFIESDKQEFLKNNNVDLGKLLAETVSRIDRKVDRYLEKTPLVASFNKDKCTFNV